MKSYIIVPARSGEWITMTIGDTRSARPVRRASRVLILDAMTTTPRWLREHRRATRAAAGPEWPADDIARRLAQELPPGELPFTVVDWDNFGSPISDAEWEPFIAAIAEAKGRPLVG